MICFKNPKLKSAISDFSKEGNHKITNPYESLCVVWENKLHLLTDTENILVVLDLTGQKQRFWKTKQSDYLVFTAKKKENKK